MNSIFPGRGPAWLGLLVLMYSGYQAQLRAQSITLTDRTLDSGIQWVHEDGSSGEEYLVELMGAGVGLFDANNDGWIDVLLLNGGALPRAQRSGVAREGFFLNQHNGNFTDSALASYLGDPEYSLGIAVGDYNNDGYEDVYISNFGPNSLMCNLGDGTFTNVAQASGTANGNQFGAGVCFLDIDADGNLDLYVGNYVDFSFARHAALKGTTFPYPPGPQHYPHATDTLLKNNGDGSFEDASQSSGIASKRGPTMGVTAGDFDLDGDTDIFVGNDAEPNHLWINSGAGQFTEMALQAGVAFDSSGRPVGSMGVEPGDVDNDGWLDLLITDYSGQLPLLFRNAGQLSFEDWSRSSRVGSEALPHANWSAGLIDLDNDGDRDLFLCQGHLLKNASTIEQLTDFRVRNSLMVNQGNGRFQSATRQSGSGLEIVQSTRGAGFDDLDNDGDLDVVLLNCAAAANLLRNDTPRTNHWLQLDLHGRQTNRSAIGSRVVAQAGGLRQVYEIHAGRSYQSHYGTRVHFGLGPASRVDRLEVHWHAGQVQVLQDLPVDQRLQLVEPESVR